GDGPGSPEVERRQRRGDEPPADHARPGPGDPRGVSRHERRRSGRSAEHRAASGYGTPVTVEETLAELGFDLVQRRRNGDLQYGKRSHPYLSWWVLTHSDGTAELSWEFELGAYLQMKGFHVSVQDELSLLIFPR